MQQLLNNFLNWQYSGALLLIWGIVCLVWVGRWKSLLGQINELAGKPIIFKQDKQPNFPLMYPRLLLEDIASGFRNTLRKPFSDLLNLSSMWISRSEEILQLKNGVSKFLGFIGLLVMYLSKGIFYILDYLFLIIGSLVPFTIDIVFRLFHIFISIFLWFIATPIIAIPYGLGKTFALVGGDEGHEKTRRKGINKRFGVSVATPKLLSKRFASPFLIQIYLPEKQALASRNIGLEFQKQDTHQQKIYSDIIKLGQMLQIKLLSPAFVFTDSVTKHIKSSLTKIIILGMPKENCELGFHKVLLSISDVATNQEIETITITVQVVDFVFGKISRPLLSRISTFVLGVGSFAMFILTFLEQIDKTIGLTSGTAAGILAAVIYANFYNLYQRIRPNTP